MMYYNAEYLLSYAVTRDRQVMKALEVRTVKRYVQFTKMQPKFKISCWPNF